MVDTVERRLHGVVVSSKMTFVENHLFVPEKDFGTMIMFENLFPSLLLLVKNNSLHAQIYVLMHDNTTIPGFDMYGKRFT